MYKDYDKILAVETDNIIKNTQGSEIQNNHPYEATPYTLLFTLFSNFMLEQGDQFVDFGSGKGRLLFYVHHLFNIPVRGIEVDKELYLTSLRNKQDYFNEKRVTKKEIIIHNCSAENYKICKKDTVFYFFNPFSITILKKVIKNIKRSQIKYPREIAFVFYYPLLEYIDYIEKQPNFELEKEVKVPHLYKINPNERFLIYYFRGEF